MSSTSGSTFKKCGDCGYVGSFVSIFRGDGFLGIAICPRDRAVWTGQTTSRSTSASSTAN